MTTQLSLLTDADIEVVSSATSLKDVPTAPNPSNATEVEQCHDAYRHFLEQYPQERDAVIERVGRLPSDSRWSATLLEWASEPGEVESGALDSCINLLKTELSKPWLQAMAGRLSARLEQIKAKWVESDVEVSISMIKLTPVFTRILPKSPPY